MTHRATLIHQRPDLWAQDLMEKNQLESMNSLPSVPRVGQTPLLWTHLVPPPLVFYRQDLGKDPQPLPNFGSKIVLTESFRSDDPIALEKGGHFCNFREKLEGSAEVLERTVTGDPAILRDGNFTYIAGWLDSIALKRIVLSVLKNAEMDFYYLPEGVRVRTNSEERFWFNYWPRSKRKISSYD